ncbi:MAG: phosphatase PAP2 family protein [Gammaproteobacteria bacterium]|nr:phosphatase PAP2 family protein [Gammaproteobacteria bacterium]
MKFRKSVFLRNIFLVSFATVSTTLLSYYFFDKPIAYWFHKHEPIPHHILQLFFHIPKIFDVAAALGVFTVHIFSWIIGRVSPFLSNLTLTSITLVITDFWTEWSKFLFGRYWPTTWTIDHNPSLIDTNDYGFHFLASKTEAFQAFPSSHASLTIASVTFLALRYPILKVPAIIISLLVVLSLVALNHNFLADTIAGAGLGWIIAYSVDAFNQGSIVYIHHQNTQNTARNN